MHGERRIIPIEADVVRRIFRDFAAGVSPRRIAAAPNAEGAPGPLGRSWSDTTIRGHVSRGTGIVNNELYAGRLVWNRQRYIKDPSSGKRVARINPESERIATEVPELRIVDEPLWTAARRRQAELAKIFEATKIGIREARAKKAQHYAAACVPALGAAYLRLLSGQIWDYHAGPVRLPKPSPPHYLYQ